MKAIRQHYLPPTNRREARMVTTDGKFRMVMTRSSLPSEGTEAERLHYAVKCFCQKFELEVPTIYGIFKDMYYWCYKAGETQSPWEPVS